MKAIILAGGEGRRLRPLTDKLPKPMVPVMNRPMMSYLLRLLKRHGITEIGVTLGYRGEVIENYFKSGQDFGVNLTYFREEVPRGTAGSLQNAAGFLDQDFLVISGDAVTDINLTSALYFHSDKNALATLVLKELEYPLDYGVVVTEPGGRIRHIAEKPDWDQVRSDMVNTGIYIMKPEILSYIPQNTVYDFARDLFPCLLAQNQPLFGYVSKNYWCDIGDIAAYQRCHKDIFLGRVDLGFSQDSLQSGVLIGKDCQIAADAVIERFTVIGDHSTIGARASVKNSILWNGSQIPEDADLYRTVCCGQQSVYLPPLPESVKAKPEPEHNRFIGVINDDITPE
ncbi:MAG: sugar phosphate nucleotidyltransferase, partial [Clostridia bacterium]